MTQRSGNPGGDGPGTVVTFYSFKGGTGRTMALANVAWILASNGKRVLTMDWDLEAPGLYRYFFPFLGDPALDSTPGVIDLVRDFDALVPRPPADRYQEYARVERYASSLRWDFPGHGYIDFVSPGRQTPEYSQAVNTYDWRGFHERRGGSAFLDALRRDMRENYDYALIDSRTGYSDTSGITTLQLPDVLVNCFTFNTQAIKGTAGIARDVQRQAPKVRILPVPMRVEDAEQGKLEVSRDHAREQFREVLQDLGEAEQERYWGDVEIPYKPFYAYEEILATVGDRPRQENTLLAAYERLTAMITDGKVTALRPIVEDQRRQLLSRFERVKTSGLGQRNRVRIDFAVRDRMWAEWISAQLAAVGVTVELRGSSPSFTHTTAAPEAPEVAETVIALLSPDFRTTPLLDGVRRLVNAGPGPKRLVAVCPMEYVVEHDLAGLPNISFAGKRSETARRDLFALLGMTAPTEPATEGVRYPGSPRKAQSAPPRNDSFTGRDHILEEVRSRMGANALRVDTPTGRAGLYGLGGMGKTQIALEYVHRYGAQYDVVWWVEADQLTTVPRTIAELGDRLGVPGDSVAERAQSTLDQLQRGDHGRFLLVFDNVSDADRAIDTQSTAAAVALQDYIPTEGPGHVIITSRHADTVSVPDMVHIDTFSRNESIALFRRRLRNISEADASRVSEALGDLPMAVELASAWLRTTVMPVDTYLQLLREQGSRALSDVGTAAQQASFTAAWQLSFDRLRQENPAAARMLEVCSFLSPEPIAASVLYGAAMREYLAELDPEVGNAMMVGHCIGALNRYGLAGPYNFTESIQVHRLLQATVREWLAEDPEKFERTRRQAHRVLAAVHASLSGIRDENSSEARRRYAELWPHLEPSGAAESDDPHVRNWIVEQVRHTWLISDHFAAVALGSRVLGIWQQRFGDDALTLRLAAQLANPLRSLAEYRRALDLDEKTLALQRAHHGPDHPFTLVTARNYGADLRGLGRYPAAYESDQDTYDRCVRIFGEEHEDTFKAANNLAISLNAVGRPAEGLVLHERTYQQRRQVTGLKNLLTWSTAVNVAQGLRDMGRYRESLVLLLETRERLVELVGEGAPDVLRADRSLAVSRRRIGEFDAALVLSRDTWGAYRERFGDLHPDTLACLTNLACDLYYSNGAPAVFEEARRLGEQVYQRYVEILGEEHPFTLAAASNLSLFLRGCQEPGAALDLANSALSRLERLLGPGHPASAVCRSARAGALSALDRHEEAASDDAVVLDAFRALFGPDHPRVLAAEYDTALEQVAAGVPQAERALGSAARRVEQHLAPESPIRRDVTTGRRVDFDLEMPP
ncbi:FxSxx-COOH system tetratricopeptide repeat protein [Peterkaempfera bronchialis]|uniref:ATP/GTP-binding protein n=1 Tax=Peterkaempfera bronchialis TaxID=2126346 RepID=A0A345T345_9ACTN|nr:FxSxx-COOH system tetratricopeptide repeat protein [Peterkaempfera bronchialis]AXI80400.1 ATP/GTP-binding protein [Peterkaempfera bronchialis]